MTDDSLPDFVVGCAHGFREGALSELVTYRWVDERGVWEPPERSPSVTVTYLEGDREGWWHRDGVQGDGTYQPLGPSRVHHEISCCATLCRRQALRIPDDDLQNLLHLIAVNDKFRRAFSSDADGCTRGVTLDGLHAARRMASKFGLVGDYRRSRQR